MRAQRDRSSLPRVALAGYTNAGKSTLLNALTGAEVGVGDRLFHTLDPTTRSLELSGRDYLLTDTVGFIEKLPHQLVEAFKATLEETVLADLILHVVDASEPRERRFADMRAVDEVLEEIGAGEKPRLLVLNKADLLSEEERQEVELAHPDAVARLGGAGRGPRDAARADRGRFRGDAGRGRAARPLRAGRAPARAARGRRQPRAHRPRGRRPRPRQGAGRRAAPVRRPQPSTAHGSVRRVRADAVTRTLASGGDAVPTPRRTRATPGLDLYACEAAHIGPGERWSVGTGIAVEIPDGHAGLVLPALGPRPRARDLPGQQPGADRLRLPRRDLASCCSTPTRRRPSGSRPGDRIAQLVIAPIALAEPVEADSLADSARGEGGFGSSGR